MIDRERLAARWRTAAIINRAFMVVPFALVFAAWAIPDFSDVASDSLPLALLLALGLLAISPLLVVRLLRKAWASRVPPVREAADPTAALASVLTQRMIFELALWEATTIIAFVMVVVGGAAAVSSRRCDPDFGWRYVQLPAPV